MGEYKVMVLGIGVINITSGGTKYDWSIYEQNGAHIFWDQDTYYMQQKTHLKQVINLNYLVKNSLYITRPTVAIYKANRAELVLGAGELFSNIKRGILNPHITEYEFKDAARAHKDLESGKTKGSLVLKL